MSDEAKIFTSIVMNKGKVTIPIETRTLHNISDGDIVTFRVISIAKQNVE